MSDRCDGIILELVWVIDKVVVRPQLILAGNKRIPLPGFFLEWPVDPSGVSDWRDIVHEALGHPGLAPSVL